MSTAPKDVQDPAATAASILEMFPGKSLAAKSGSALFATSVTVWLFSKEIYLVDAEFFEMICLFGAYGILAYGGKDAAKSYFSNRKAVSHL